MQHHIKTSEAVYIHCHPECKKLPHQGIVATAPLLSHLSFLREAQ